jgi:hypothetical protein
MWNQHHGTKDFLETNNRSASQEISRLLWIRGGRKRPSLDPILSQLNPAPFVMIASRAKCSCVFRSPCYSLRVSARV